MPKVIVLYAATDSSAASIAAAAAEGANEIRFTEVDVRVIRDTSASGAGAAARHKLLDDAQRIADYDGVIVALSGADVPVAVNDALAALANGLSAESAANKVFAIAGATTSEILACVGRLGGIIVSAPHAAPAPKVLGGRVAKVAEWVRHALSHEAKAHHHH